MRRRTDTWALGMMIAFGAGSACSGSDASGLTSASAAQQADAGHDADQEGGSAGSAGTGGQAGSGGGCSETACDDGFACTIDRCEGDVCVHVVGPNDGETACPAGQVCELDKGCVPGIPCSDTEQCKQRWQDDGCKINVRCEAATSTCAYDTLDNDHDGHPAPVCGGADCNDADPQQAPGKPEVCNGLDDDCDGTIDEGATCSGLAQCVAGSCQCDPQNQCGSECVDKSSDRNHCGECFHACSSGATCINGTCECSDDAIECPSGCVDAQNDPLNCGGCNQPCAPGYSCLQGKCACELTPCNGGCIDTSSDPLNCGGCGVQCPAGITCADSQCQCPTGQRVCGSKCVDTSTDESHCGKCDAPCAQGARCEQSQCRCPSGQSVCSDTCVDLMTDPDHCGRCDNACGRCENGQCMCAPAAVVFLVDRSGSMTDLLGGAPRWNALSDAMGRFLYDPASQSLRVGLQFLPLGGSGPSTCQNDGDCGAYGPCLFGVCLGASGVSCEAPDYATPVVQVGPVSTVGPTIMNLMASETPNGGTPTAPAVQGTLDYSQIVAQGNDYRVSLVLLTDGAPNTCQPQAFADVAQIIEGYQTGSPRVDTYVVGIANEVPPADLDLLAEAGGTGTGYVTGSSDGILAALAAIRSRVNACN